MEKMFVKRKGPGWDKTADEIYQAYLGSGKKLQIEFESIFSRYIDGLVVNDHQKAYKLNVSVGKLLNKELLTLRNVLEHSSALLCFYMKVLAINDDYFARYSYVKKIAMNYSAEDLRQQQSLVFYVRDATLE